MDLHLPTAGLDRYKSASQRARVGTESWGASNFFCPACESPRLQSAPQGTAAIDYFCPSCDSPFQLKSQSKAFGSRIVDAAYSEMKRAIVEDGVNGLLVPPGDSVELAQTLQRIVGDSKLRAELGNGAANYVKQNHDHRGLAIEFLNKLQPPALHG